MKILTIISLLLTNTTYAWTCGQTCPSNSNQLECELYQLICQQNFDTNLLPQWGKKFFPIFAKDIFVQNVNQDKKQPQRLTKWQRKWLGPFLKQWKINPYQIRIVYEAQLLNKHQLLKNLPFTIMDDTLAQTFGDIIYIKRAYKPRDGGLLTLLSHEIYHVKQYKELQSISNFGAKYAKEFVNGGFSYDNNRMEIEAYQAEAKFRKWLCKHRYWRCK
jgi:hypothetical protein